MSRPLRYHPVLRDADSTIRESQPARVLVVGHEVPDSVHLALNARILEMPEAALPIGVYVFESSGGLELMVVDTQYARQIGGIFGF